MAGTVTFSGKDLTTVPIHERRAGGTRTECGRGGDRQDLSGRRGRAPPISTSMIPRCEGPASDLPGPRRTSTPPRT